MSSGFTLLVVFLGAIYVSFISLEYPSKCIMTERVSVDCKEKHGKISVLYLYKTSDGKQAYNVVNSTGRCDNPSDLEDKMSLNTDYTCYNKPHELALYGNSFKICTEKNELFCTDSYINSIIANTWIVVIVIPVSFALVML